jgi:hypothetical protein
MADIAPQMWMEIERRLTKMEQRLDALEEQKPKFGSLLSLSKIFPRVSWALLVIGLAALQAITPDQAIKTLSFLLVR